jgi:hypothetical protein
MAVEAKKGSKKPDPSKFEPKIRTQKRAKKTPERDVCAQAGATKVSSEPVSKG